MLAGIAEAANTASREGLAASAVPDTSSALAEAMSDSLTSPGSSFRSATLSRYIRMLQSVGDF